MDKREWKCVCVCGGGVRKETNTKGNGRKENAGKEMRGEEKGRKGEERKEEEKTCMSSQAGSVRPLCHVSQPQPLYTTHIRTRSALLPRRSCSLCHSESLIQATSHTLISPLSFCRIIRTKVQQQPGQTGSVSAHSLGRLLLSNHDSQRKS